MPRDDLGAAASAAADPALPDDLAPRPSDADFEDSIRRNERRRAQGGPSLDALQRLRDRHWPVETQAIDDDGAGHPAILCGAHPWPVGWPCPEVVAIDEEAARLGEPAPRPEPET